MFVKFVSMNEEVVAHPSSAVHTASDVSTLHSCAQIHSECIS